MKKYSGLEAIIKKEFGSLGKFSKQAQIPLPTISRLISGKYGSQEKKIKIKIENAIKKLKPEIQTERLWDCTEDYFSKMLTDKMTAKKGIRIIVDIQINDEGGLVALSRVEGH